MSEQPKLWPGRWRILVTMMGVLYAAMFHRNMTWDEAAAVLEGSAGIRCRKAKGSRKKILMLHAEFTFDNLQLGKIRRAVSAAGGHVIAEPAEWPNPKSFVWAHAAPARVGTHPALEALDFEVSALFSPDITVTEARS